MIEGRFIVILTVNLPNIENSKGVDSGEDL